MKQISVRRLPFFKMHGGGNDFVLVDHRQLVIPAAQQSHLARLVCTPKTGVGADGLILLENSEVADLRWQFYNADGSVAEMCGNGARCAARFAVLTGLTGSHLTLETLAGVIHCEVEGRAVRLLMADVGDFRLHLAIPLADQTLTGHFVKVGVPHTVIPVADLEETPVSRLGREVRFHPMFLPAGTNVNFVRVTSLHTLQNRTYERGVEDETLACGTGAVAAALVHARLGQVRSPVQVHTRGGEILTVSFEMNREEIRQVFLEGEAHVVFQGELWLEEFQ